MKYIETMWAWTPCHILASKTRGLVEVGVWPDKNNWCEDYQKTDGACWLHTHKYDRRKVFNYMLYSILQMVDKDGVNFNQALEEFKKIDEFIEEWAALTHEFSVK